MDTPGLSYWKHVLAHYPRVDTDTPNPDSRQTKPIGDWASFWEWVHSYTVDWRRCGHMEQQKITRNSRHSMELPGFENHRAASITMFLCSQEIWELIEHTNYYLKAKKVNGLTTQSSTTNSLKELACKIRLKRIQTTISQAMSYHTIMSW